MANVLLFREPTAGPSQDRYETLFNDAGYTAKCVPVLETVHTNVPELGRTVLRDHEGYSGVVVTSKRSCDAFQEALQGLRGEEGLSKALASWSALPFYVVGEATASAVRNVQMAFKDQGFSAVNTLGQASGTGEQLGHFIVKEHPKGGKDLLYLTGDKNRDTVARLLKDGGISFRALQVYETRPLLDFASRLEEAVTVLDQGEKEWWIAYFAPSSAAFVAPIARAYPVLASSHIASIGPVTSKFLQHNLGIAIQVTADKPKPEDLLRAISNYDSGR
ncbi:tetrapyrrole biosynthesis, uroporphyrinogen III synthase [Coprinopsis marcescibilis]|uniref:Tetrapyrrole biosynthesis, uroporphyrinogen III synthase n=1 Tax=Coprinopsis marcescibilis TaxID=230819 RepID=A0A5C3L3B2_COPMA|nr:tetrapyrrole biosynthesis, uroporphyrinogen III synthase [Coprinopsis marcescibilis]